MKPDDVDRHPAVPGVVKGRFGDASRTMQPALFRYAKRRGCRSGFTAAEREYSKVIYTGLILILVIFCCGGAYVLIRRGEGPRWPKGNSVANPYVRAQKIFSSTQAVFFELLEQALDDRYWIFGNVRLTEVVDVRQDLPGKQRQTALKRLPASRLDFVISERKNASIIGVVMINEKTAQADGAMAQRETALEEFLASVGIPVALLSGSRDYSIEQLRIEISRALFLKWKDGDPANGKEGGYNTCEKNSRPYGACPACGQPFVKRKARKGTYAGKYFLTCSNYPKCKHIRLIKDKTVQAQNAAFSRSIT